MDRVLSVLGEVKEARRRRVSAYEATEAAWRELTQLEMEADLLGEQLSELGGAVSDVSGAGERPRPVLEEELEAVRAQAARAAEHLNEREGELEAAEVALRARRQTLGQVLEAWLEQVASKHPPHGEHRSLARWGEFLYRWRDAEDLSMRQAGQVLQASSATVSRYEAGQRQPTLPVVREQVQAIARMGAAPLDSYRLLGRSAEDADESADVDEREAEALRHRLEGAAGQLQVRHLASLVALAEAPDALEQIARAAMEPDPLRVSLKRALTTH